MANFGFYFSPTGGTKKVTEILTSCLEDVRMVDVTLHPASQELTENDICIVSVPSYGGRVPAIALERLASVRGNGAKAIAVVAFGNRAIDDTLLELKNGLEKLGFQVVAGMEAVAEHSIIRDFGAGRPDAEDEKELKAFMASIDYSNTALSVPGNFPYKAFGGVPMVPSAGSSCTGCGICEKECVTGAIQGKSTDKHKCISCMRCISVCPSGARKLNSVMVLAAKQGLKKACGGRKENKLYI